VTVAHSRDIISKPGRKGR